MPLADELEQTRSALTMINQSPFNAEAPPGALAAETTPTELHYVRSNFAVPAHDGVLEIGGAVDHPIRLTLDDMRTMPAVEHAVTLECAGNGRLEVRPLPVGEPWGDNAVSTARWKGVLLHEVLALAQPAAKGVEVLFRGADSGAYHLSSVLAATDESSLVFERSLALDLATDPAAEILIAYEMNGQPLPPDHGAPFRIIVPRWYAVASVKWVHRIEVLTEPFSGEFQTGHYIFEWPDRPHEPVTLMRVRARVPPIPPRLRPSRPGPTPFGAKPGRVRDRSRTSNCPSLAKASGSRLYSSLPRDRTSGRSGRSTGTPRSGGTASRPGRPMRTGTCSQKSRCGTGWATGTTPSRFHTSTRADSMAQGSGARWQREACIQKRCASVLHTLSRSHLVSHRSSHSRPTRHS